MATQNQIDANRRNAQKSTGPTTPEGRAAVRLNGLKHGLTASDLVFPGESEADFEALFDSIQAEHQPTTPTEVAIVRRIAMATWRLLRSYRVEAGFYTIRRIDMTDELRRNYKNLASGDKLAVIVRNDSLGANTLDNISRYEGRLERSLDKSLGELQRLRSSTYKRMQNQSQFPPTPPALDPPTPRAPDPPTTPLGTAPSVSAGTTPSPVPDANDHMAPIAGGRRSRLPNPVRKPLAPQARYYTRWNSSQLAKIFVAHALVRATSALMPTLGGADFSLSIAAFSRRSFGCGSAALRGRRFRLPGRSGANLSNLVSAGVPRHPTPTGLGIRSDSVVDCERGARIRR